MGQNTQCAQAVATERSEKEKITHWNHSYWLKMCNKFTCLPKSVISLFICIVRFSSSKYQMTYFLLNFCKRSMRNFEGISLEFTEHDNTKSKARISHFIFDMHFRAEVSQLWLSTFQEQAKVFMYSCIVVAALQYFHIWNGKPWYFLHSWFAFSI